MFDEGLVARFLDVAQFFVDPVEPVVNLRPLRRERARLVEEPHDERSALFQRAGFHAAKAPPAANPSAFAPYCCHSHDAVPVATVTGPIIN